jgi:hypothetical protein
MEIPGDADDHWQMEKARDCRAPAGAAVRAGSQSEAGQSGRDRDPETGGRRETGDRRPEDPKSARSPKPKKPGGAAGLASRRLASRVSPLAL